MESKRKYVEIMKELLKNEYIRFTDQVIHPNNARLSCSTFRNKSHKGLMINTKKMNQKREKKPKKIFNTAASEVFKSSNQQIKR